MTILTRWRRRLHILANESKGPWGSGGGDGGSDGDGGPRNPWTVPPGGQRGRARPTALDEFLKRARGGGGPGGGGGGGGFPGGANGRNLALIGIVLLLGAWLLFTSLHIIGPQQRGVVTFFGRYTGTLDPGYRWTLPSPFASVKKVDVQAIQTDDFPKGGDATNLMLTGDQNLIDLSYSVRWNVKNPQNYVFEIKDQVATLRATAESAMRAVIATSTLNEAIGPGQAQIAQRVQDLMQQVLDSYHSGIQVQGVTLKRVDPPAQVIDDFKAVSAAKQSAQADINNAHTYAEQIVARAQGEAAQFDKVYEQYKLAPQVTRRRMYYETMEDVLSRAHKTIVEPNGVVPYLPLDRATRPQPQPQPASSAATGGGQ